MLGNMWIHEAFYSKHMLYATNLHKKSDFHADLMKKEYFLMKNKLKQDDKITF